MILLLYYYVASSYNPFNTHSSLEALRLTPSHSRSQRPPTHADYDEILNVDVVDDEHVYGRAQYTESDIIRVTNVSEDKVATQLRELVVGSRRNGR